MNRFWILTLSLVFSALMNQAIAKVTSVTATVDKNPAMADESIVLTVTANGDADRTDFDPSPLLKDFVVGRTSVSSQTQMVNFNTTRSTTWTTTIIPRTEGDFTVPAFEVAGQATQPINIRILPVSANPGGEGRDLFITASVETPTVYLQQQIKYSVKLHLAVDLQRGSLAAPQLENADIRQIGKDAEYTDIIKGKRYRIIERTFAITPQKSGTYRISGPLFEGEVIDNSRQSFGFFNRTKNISRVGPSIDIEVLSIPAGINGHWLPSEFVQLNEEWQPQPGQFKVGEPITRTLTLTAVGLVEEQLPEIGSQYPASVKTYPDQANTATVERDNTLIAQRVESIAIIPSQTGDITFPEVVVPWFNVVTQQTEYARLAARTIQVAPADNSGQAAIPTLEPSVIAGPQNEPGVESQPSNTGLTSHSWWPYSTLIFMCLWLFTLIGWLLHSKKNRATPSYANASANDSVSWQTLQKALKTHDVRQIYAPLTKWLAQHCGEASAALPTSQRLIADAQLDKAIRTMFEQQYGEKTAVWRSDDLAKQLARIAGSRSSGMLKGTHLRPLYPETN